MLRERSLFERLRSTEPQRPPSIRENTNLLADSVLNNLRRLLNSRHGIAPTCRDYGIPDVCDVVHDFPDAIGGIRGAIKAAIEKYEPRLRRVNVRHAPMADDSLSLRFEITAELVTEQEKAGIRFETRVSGSGEVNLKG